MVTDAFLAILHHTLVFGLVAILAAEAALLRVKPVPVGFLARIDLAYGIAAGLLVCVGVARVELGVKGAGYYVHNPVFWLKMALFGCVGLISIMPTVRFIQWRRRSAESVPDASQIQSVRRWVGLQALVLLFVMVCAVLMARGFT